MPNAIVTVTAVEKKEGVSKKSGKPYTKYVIHSDAGDYSTFSGNDAQKAFELVGQLASVNYTTGDFGNDLGFIDPAPADAVVAESIRARTDDGGADWDLIGLRKTRCLLWAHFIGSETAKAIIEATTEGPKADALYRIGSRLIALAERDIYHRAPASDTEDVPF